MSPLPRDAVCFHFKVKGVLIPIASPSGVATRAFGTFFVAVGSVRTKLLVTGLSYSGGYEELKLAKSS